MAGLHRRDDAELLEARNVAHVQDLRVLDTPPLVGSGDAGVGKGLAHPVEDELVAFIADGVEGDLDVGV